MGGKVKLAYTISKDAMKLIKSGKAVLSSGGVRSLTGELIELAVPAAQNVAMSGGNPAFAAIDFASSVAGNVQMGFIQHSVNITNRKLTATLKKLDLLQNSMGTITTLSWVNCALGMVNCGISIAGFKMTLDRLNQVSNQIKQIASTIDKEILVFRIL